MRRSAAVAALLLAMTAGPLWAQGKNSGQEEKAKKDKKLQSEFLKKAPWITDYDKARQEAKKSGKVIFAYFTRSYAA